MGILAIINDVRCVTAYTAINSNKIKISNYTNIISSLYHINMNTNYNLQSRKN